MAYWLMKSEPNVNSWDDVVGRGVPEEWHSVRNYTARNNMKAMKLGEKAFFYHSNIGKEIVGIMEVVALAHPDSTAEPNDKGQIIWECVDMMPVKKCFAAIARSPRVLLATSVASSVAATRHHSDAGSACARLPPMVPRVRTAR